jgi:hypothetical protein
VPSVELDLVGEQPRFLGDLADRAENRVLRDLEG